MDTQYREALKHLATVASAAVPDSWQELGTEATFYPGNAVGSSCWHRDALDSPQIWVDVPTELSKKISDSLRAVRDALMQSGNPTPSGLTFRVSRAGKASVDVRYA